MGKKSSALGRGLDHIFKDHQREEVDMERASPDDAAEKNWYHRHGQSVADP